MGDLMRRYLLDTDDLCISKLELNSKNQQNSTFRYFSTMMNNDSFPELVHAYYDENFCFVIYCWLGHGMSFPSSIEGKLLTEP